MITVIDLNLGNVASVVKALKKIGASPKVINRPEDIIQAEKIVLPGVGSYYQGMKRLRALGLEGPLGEAVLKRKIPILGICLGMQLLTEFGEEGGPTKGLGFIKADVLTHRAKAAGFQLPHIGWNDVNFNSMDLFCHIKEESCFYFIHSYEVILKEDIPCAFCHYGVDFVAAFRKENISGVQFHPEKSQEAGLNLLKNFC